MLWSQTRELAAPAGPESPSPSLKQAKAIFLQEADTVSAPGPAGSRCPVRLPQGCTSELPLVSSPWCEGTASPRFTCRTAVVDSQRIMELPGSVSSNPPTSGASLGNWLRKRPSPHTIWKWFLKNLLIIVKKQHVGFCKTQMQQQAAPRL